jgi:glycosyltransferase involved in cell wall biosynthesis
MRLALVINSLAAGGAERVTAMLAGAWVERGHEVTLFTYDHGEKAFYALDRRVRLRPLALAAPSLGALHGLTSNVRRIRRLRAELRRDAPDCVVSFVDQVNVITAVAAVGLGCRVVVAERVDPAMAPIPRGWRWLRDRAYRLADVIVVQTAGAVRSLPAAVRSRSQVIPNPVRTQAASPPRAGGRRTVLGVGRLVPQKGFDLLIGAFARLSTRFPDWDLVILGEGPARADLEARVRAAKLEGRVLLVGLVPDVDSHYAQADVFVLSSRFEGFPNALCEAMSWGVAAIATDCRSGPAEIVRHDIDGLLVSSEDIDGLTAALERLLGDDDTRRRLGLRAREIGTRFSLDTALAAWDTAISLLRGP